MPASQRVAVLAVGTRGDVQPLLELAIALLRACPQAVVTLITHAAHVGWVQPPAEAAGVSLHLLSALPARVWETGAPTPQAGKCTQPECRDRSSSSSGGHAPHGDDAEDAATVRADCLREELAAACEAALGCALPAGSGSAHSALGDGGRLLVFNLFALEGFHLAEALAVPCLAVSPCLVPYAPPPSFERRFAAAHPALHARLRVVDEQQAQGPDSPTAVTAASVGWRDVQHWLWPLFNEERWGPWRHHRLGLPAVPYSACPRDAPLPPPPPLLYLVSEAVVPRPGWWPPSAHMCGFTAGLGGPGGEAQQLPAHVQSVLAAEAAVAQAEAAAARATEPAAVAAAAAAPAAAAHARPGPIGVDFGSMGALGLLPRPQLLAAVLHRAARLLGRRVLLLTGGWHPLVEACQVLDQQQQQPGQQPGQQAQAGPPWLTALAQPVLHAALLPRCAALLHHGGAGTTAAALRAGTPQLVCPLHFDQQQWAERVEWLGCGAQIGSAALLQAADSDGETQEGDRQPAGEQAVEEAAKAVAASLAALLHSSSVAARCSNVRQQLASEDGAAAAAQLAWQHLEQQQQRQQHHAAEASGRQASGEGPSSAQRGGEPALWAPAQEVRLPGGLTVRCHWPSEAAFIHREIFVHDCYLSRGIRLPPGSTVVDAGANIGLFALRLLRDPTLGPSVAALHAFEPLPPNADLLEANLQAHGLADRVTLLRCGLHSAPGTLPFTWYPAMPGNSTAAPREKWEHQRPAMAAGVGAAAAERRFRGAARVDCPVTTLALYARERRLQRIDLLKVDVEGSELELLRGLEGAWGLVRQAVVEVHDVDGRLEAATRLLEAHGFAVHAEPAAEGPAGNWMLYAWQLHPDGRDHG